MNWGRSILDVQRTSIGKINSGDLFIIYQRNYLRRASNEEN